jgi:regulator of nucleoside diphosphate kinase
MQDKTKKRRKPAITVCETDLTKLSALAAAIEERAPHISEELLSELDRARVVADHAIAQDVVRIGSTVEFKPDTGEARTVTLVLPADADISEGRISILTPIGTALLGLSPGQTMSWYARDGRRHELSVISVGHGDMAAADGRAVDEAVGV